MMVKRRIAMFIVSIEYWSLREEPWEAQRCFWDESLAQLDMQIERRLDVGTGVRVLWEHKHHKRKRETVDADDRDTTTMARLWMGGTSGLAQTYFHRYPTEPWIIIGKEPTRPAWLDERHRFVSLDLTSATSAGPTLTGIDTIIIGIRPPLAILWSHSRMMDYNARLFAGLEQFLSKLLADNAIKTLIHVSSVAAVNHSIAQFEWDESHPVESNLKYPYDRFKRDCEQLTSKLGHNIGRCTSLRLSAIFADTAGCIQCGALQLQSLVAADLSTRIDCNSARNVASCLSAMLDSKRPSFADVYYYTRCTKEPVPYGSHLRDYLHANDIGWTVWIPMWMVAAFVTTMHWLAAWLPWLQSIDYLLQVSSRDHCFVNRLVHDHFGFAEETILECFQRRRRRLLTMPGKKQEYGLYTSTP